MKSTNRATTRDHLIDVAERHFAEYGFGGTSLRGIIKDAKVNVAAVAYHFGGKEELYSAVMQRFALPVVEEQLTKLQQEMQNQKVRIEDVIDAFYAPPIKRIHSLGKKGATLSLFLGRAQTETGEVFALIDQHYSGCRSAFIDAFRKLLPGLSEADYNWHFEFMLSLIVCFLTRQAPIRERYGDSQDWDADEVLARLRAFCAAGMKAKL